jgi:hypothetical protein
MAALICAPALPLLAADDARWMKLEEPAGPNKNRFGVSYRAGFNVTAQFKNVGNIKGPSAGRDPGPDTGGGVDRFYDDGYNRVDISGNKDGLTWFWGHKNAPGQVPGNDTIVMHSTTASPITSKTYDSDPEHGFELTYNRELGRGKNGKWSWGLEGAFGWTDIEIRDQRRLAGGVETISDAFGLEGVDPNGQPTSAEYPGHEGDYEGPNTLIEDNPTRSYSSSPNGSRVSGVREFDADLFSFRLGPYVDVPLDKKWTLSFSAGLAVGVIDGVFHFDQKVTTGIVTHQVGTGSKTDVLWGGYASATVRYAIDEHWGVFASGQYVGLTDLYTASARGQKVELDLQRTALFALGVSYSF